MTDNDATPNKIPTPKDISSKYEHLFEHIEEIKEIVQDADPKRVDVSEEDADKLKSFIEVVDTLKLIVEQVAKIARVIPTMPELIVVQGVGGQPHTGDSFIIDGQLYFDRLASVPIQTPIGPFATQEEASQFLIRMKPYWGSVDVIALGNPVEVAIRHGKLNAARFIDTSIE